MKTRVILLSVVLVFMVPSLSQGQVGSILRNRINRAIDKKIEEKIDTAINKSVQDAQQKEAEEAKQTEQTEQTDQGEKAQTQRQGKGINLGGLLGGKVTSKYNESYSFNNRIYMQMEMYDKKDVVKSDFYVYFNDASDNGGFESKMQGTSDGEQVTTNISSIYDATNKVFLILTDMGAMKMGIISNIPDEETVEGQTTIKDQPEVNTSKSVVTKTGNRKVIAGYKCDEYLVRDTETNEHGNLWITRDLKLKSDKRTYSKARAPVYYDHPELADGVVLAMESYSAKDELEMKSETKEINLGINHTITTAGYALRQMNFDQAGEKK